MGSLILFWRRTDAEGMERMELSSDPEGVTARSTVIRVGDGGFRIDHRWRLSPEWRAQEVEVE